MTPPGVRQEGAWGTGPLQLIIGRFWKRDPCLYQLQLVAIPLYEGRKFEQYPMADCVLIYVTGRVEGRRVFGNARINIHLHEYMLPFVR